MKGHGKITVSGPGVMKPYADAGVALSGATTFACQAAWDQRRAEARDEVTFYVRDEHGAALGRATSGVDGVVRTYKIGGAK